MTPFVSVSVPKRLPSTDSPAGVSRLRVGFLWVLVTSGVALVSGPFTPRRGTRVGRGWGRRVLLVSLHPGGHGVYENPARSFRSVNL